MNKTTNKFSAEVRERAVRMVLEHEGDYASRWAAIVSVAGKIGCVPQTLHTWLEKTDIDGGRRAGVTTEVAADSAVGRKGYPQQIQLGPDGRLAGR